MGAFLVILVVFLLMKSRYSNEEGQGGWGCGCLCVILVIVGAAVLGSI